MFLSHRFAAFFAVCCVACGARDVSVPSAAVPTSSRSAATVPTEHAQIDGLVAFTKIFGHLRYFHPSDEGANADWEALAVNAVPVIESARGPNELAAALSAVFRPVAPTVRIYPGEHAPPPPELEPPAGIETPTFVGWVHHGVSLDIPQPIYSSTRITNNASPHVAPGDLALMLPMSAVRGKRVRARASARAELGDSHASVVVILFTTSGAGYRVIASTPVTSTAWTDVEIVGDVPNTERGAAYVGLRLTGEGKAWIDDVSLSELAEGSLVPVALENPGFEATKSGAVPAGWQGEDADSRDYRTTTSSTKPRKGLRCGQVESVPLPVEALPRPAQTLHVELGAGVSAEVPLTLYVDAQGRTIPATTASTEPLAPMQERQFRYSANDRAVRIADVVLAWSLLENFFPYFDVVSADWPAQLRVALAGAMLDTNAKMFHATLKRLVAHLHDGHALVSRFVPGAKGREAVFRRASLPIGWRIVEGKLVVTDVAAAAGDIRPGDLVVSIDGVPTARAVATARELISAGTTEYLADREALDLLWGPYDEDVEVSFQRGASAPFSARLTLLPDVPT